MEICDTCSKFFKPGFEPYGNIDNGYFCSEECLKKKDEE
jgi:hypothetical protein